MTDPYKAIEQFAANKIRKARLRKDWIGFGIRLIILVGLVYLIFTQLFFFRIYSGNDMFPGVKDGDVLLCCAFDRAFKRGAVVVYNVDGEEYVGRIVATGGDIVEITHDGSLVVNNSEETGEIMFPTERAQNSTVIYPEVVPADSVFLLGDYRTNTTDSRDFGSIPTKDIKGYTMAILRHRGV